MGKIVIHAGMGKAGSSSIQTWLASHAPTLRQETGFVLLRANLSSSGEVEVGEYRRGSLNSGVVIPKLADVRNRDAIDGFFSQLDRHARSHEAVLISSEGFSTLFHTLNENFLKGLEQVAQGHDVQVAYYVRPQHTALEAAWRQWGFRMTEPPSRYLQWRAKGLHYLQTLTGVRDLVPSATFVPRPFRRDLLYRENVVADFVQAFLGMPAEDDDVMIWDNTGLRLDVVNAIHPAPEGLFWLKQTRPLDPRDNRALRAFKEIATDVEVPESDQVRLSRLVLQQACHERFEAENRDLISELGWDTTEWVPAVDEDVGEASLDRMDELWRPQASEAELAVLHAALAQVVDAQRKDLGQQAARAARRPSDTSSARSIRNQLVARAWRSRAAGLVGRLRSRGRSRS